MPSNTVTDRASETGSLPPATLTELRESLTQRQQRRL